MVLLDPERDPLGAGWNIIQSKTAIGSGGLFGKGLFEGTQSHLDFLPESRTDFIIAVLGEELGAGWCCHAAGPVCSADCTGCGARCSGSGYLRSIIVR